MPHINAWSQDDSDRTWQAILHFLFGGQCHGARGSSQLPATEPRERKYKHLSELKELILGRIPCTEQQDSTKEPQVGILDVLIVEYTP